MSRPSQFISLPAQIMDIMRGLHPTVVSSFRVDMFFLRKYVYKVYYTKKNMFTKSTTQRKHVYKVYYTKKRCLLLQ